MIALEPHAAGTILPVRAQPGARRNEIRGEQDGMLKVSVTQVAEKGKANKLISSGGLSAQVPLELLSGETFPGRFLSRYHP